MALDFPASPSVGQTYAFGNKTWSWNGTGWALVVSGSPKVTVTGTATLDFTTTPSETASVAITGQSGILSTSSCQAWFAQQTTTDNSAAEHAQAAACISLSCEPPVEGVGFTIDADCMYGLATGQFIVNWSWT